MAKLKYTPKNFTEAREILSSHGKKSVRLGNNTYLEDLPGLQFIGVRLHNTYIVRFHYNGKVTLHTGGYRTVTTKERINQFIKGSVWQKNYQWFYTWPITPGNDEATWDERTVKFEEGMEVQQ